MKHLRIIAWLACLAVGSSPLFAFHNRGNDAWIEISSLGVVTVTATTQWEKGTIGSSGVDSDRFGSTAFACEQNGSVVTLVPPTGAAACEALQDFSAQLLAFRKNKKLTAAQAAQLASEANAIGALLGC